jgi:hypothetical protein
MHVDSRYRLTVSHLLATDPWTHGFEPDFVRGSRGD